MYACLAYNVYPNNHRIRFRGSNIFLSICDKLRLTSLATCHLLWIMMCQQMIWQHSFHKDHGKILIISITETSTQELFDMYRHSQIWSQFFPISTHYSEDVGIPIIITMTPGCQKWSYEISSGFFSNTNGNNSQHVSHTKFPQGQCHFYMSEFDTYPGKLKSPILHKLHASRC